MCSCIPGVQLKLEFGFRPYQGEIPVDVVVSDGILTYLEPDDL